MKVNNSGERLKGHGESTEGHKSALIHSLHKAIEEESELVEPDQFVEECEQNRKSNIPTTISKHAFDHTTVGNVVFDWSLGLLMSSGHMETDDVPTEVKMMTENHPDLSEIQRVLLIIASVKLEPQKKHPSPTATIEHLRNTMSTKSTAIEVGYRGNADMFKIIGVEESDITVRDDEIDAVHLDTALPSIKQAIMSWSCYSTITWRKSRLLVSRKFRF